MRRGRTCVLSPTVLPRRQNTIAVGIRFLCALESAQFARVVPRTYREAGVEVSMAKYRMDIFKPGRKPGHPAPLLWRRCDIYASDDAAAKAKAEDLYRTHASQRIL